MLVEPSDSFPFHPGPATISGHFGSVLLQGRIWPVTLYLIDGHYHIYRNHFGMRPLTNRDGVQVQAVYGVIGLIHKLKRDRRPERWAVAMDATGPTFRDEIYPEYKANREAMPEELVRQMAWIEEALVGLRIPVLRREGYEADDIIATLARAAEARGEEVLILSRDKDLEQVLSSQVKLFDLSKNEIYGPDELREKKGITPDRVVEYQALVGDSSDNIPGVAGIGPKSASKLLAAVDDVEQLLEAPDPEGVSPKMLAKVREKEAELKVSRRLARLITDVPLELGDESFAVLAPDPDVLRPLYRSLGFRQYLSELEEETQAPSVAAPPVRYTLIQDAAEFSALLERCRQAGRFAFDTETTGLDRIVDRAVGVSVAVEESEAFYVPLEGPGGASFLPREELVARLRPLLEDPTLGKIGHHLKFDAQIMAQDGVELTGIAFDTMVAAYLLHPGRATYKLDTLVGEIFGHEMIPIRHLIGEGDEERSMVELEPGQICEYAAEDADYTLRLAHHLEREVATHELGRVLAVELPLIEVLVTMEREGITLDLLRLAELETEVATAAATLETQIHEAAGGRFNIQSTQQLAGVLFDQHGLPVLQKTKTGRSTKGEVLEELAARFPEQPLPGLVLEYRSLTKLLSTYIQALPKLVKPETGRLHTDFRQTVAATGRLSSNDPNLQNIPVRSELGRRIRQAFVPNHRDHCFLSADYSQIELRLLAHLSGDAALGEALRAGQDLHASVAATIHDKPVQEVTREERNAAKAVNFGVIYGLSPFGLARGIGVSMDEAQRYIQAFFDGYPDVRRFIDETIEQARATGEVRTLLGRRRQIVEIHSRVPHMRQRGERFAVNTVVQGSAADLIKQAMIDIHAYLRDQGGATRMLLQIHDELLFEVPTAEVEERARSLKRLMENVVELDVPLIVETSQGENWFDASK